MAVIKVVDWMSKDVYSKGFRHGNKSHCKVNWAKTNVCAEVRCFKCGRLNQHYDGPYFFFFKCECGAHYAVDRNIAMIELTPEQIERVGEKRFHETNPHVDFWIDQDAIKMVPTERKEGDE